MSVKFSIIIPAYNAEKYLDECLNSVAEQDYKDYELIIIDDGSTDATAEILDTYNAAHENCLVLHGPNDGLLLARRKGLKHANGDYIVFLDADDTLRLDALKVLANAINETNADIVAFRFSDKPDFESPYSALEILASDYYVDEDFNKVKEFVCTTNFNHLCNKAIRRSYIDIDTDYSSFAGVMHGEDLIQLLPIIDKSKSLLMLEDVLYFYRPSETSSTISFKQSQLTDLAKVNERLIAYAIRWGNSCYQAALRGELTLYITRLKRSEMSNISTAEKKRNFQSIREAMINEDVFSRSLSTKQRPDKYLICHFLKSGNRTMTRLIIQLVESLKHLR